MQLTNAPDAQSFQQIEKALDSQRLNRYLPAADKDRARAFNYYLWNCALCEAFHLPLHMAEICCRNALHQALLARAKDTWFEEKTFRTILDDRFRQELDGAVEKERHQHGAKFNSHHVVSALTFGFWEHLATKRFDRYLWAKGIHAFFPYAPKKMTYLELHGLIESVRRWRNRIAHHRAIFDKGPTRKHQDALELIQWACATTGDWVSAVSKVPPALKLRP